MARSGKYDAVICVGAVIRGNTSHYDYVCNEVSKGIASVSLETGIPVLFGVLTTENIEQAIERAGTKAGNKGYSVNSYIRKERIALACRLLRENPQISAEQMADAVGYHDEKYFVKLFQQSMGIGFAEYKKQLKRQEF